MFDEGKIHWRPLFATAAICALLGGCATSPQADRVPSWGKLPSTLSPSPASVEDDAVARQPSATPPLERPDNSFYRPGTGKFAVSPIADARVQRNGDIKLNFQDANVLEVIKVILNDMLQVTYVVDPRVQGTVSMQTSKALHRDDLIPTLELLLRMNEAALITDDGIYKVVPLATALTGVRAPQLGDSTLPLPSGYSVRVVPLKYVSAEEMALILQPFTTGSNQLVRVDTQRNLLVLAASGTDMDRLLETIHVFDVDRMKGMSVAMFTPDFVDAKTLADELEKLLADPQAGLMAGLVRFIVVERLNGLMVVTPRAEYLAQVRDWVNRLDRDSGNAGRRLFIYRVQNGKATDLAEMLSSLFEEEKSERPPGGEVAPGMQPVTLGDAETPRPGDSQVTPSQPRPQTKVVNVAEPSGDGLTLDAGTEVRIIADEPNNALLVLASATEYRQILTALQQLDVNPMQVLIEVTIAEVTLTDNLQYGVEWYFNNYVSNSPDLTGVGRLDLPSIGGLVSGFSYAFQGSDGSPRAVLKMLAEESNLSIVSSPTLLVLNNQEASIQVGEEVPVATQQQQTTLDSDANIINSIEYRDTGVLLTVKPRINSGGLVIMEVDQETSTAPDVIDDVTPRIQTRKISSTVAVNSGDTIILGGLIQNNHNRSASGIPVLHQMPLIGNLFGADEDNQDRKELLVLITPRAISNRNSALQVTEDFRRKMNSLVPLFEQAGPDEAPGAATSSESHVKKNAEPIPAREPPAEEPVNETAPASPKRAGSKVSPKPVCWEFGSYSDVAQADKAASALSQGFESIGTVKAEANEIIGYYVLIPAAENREAAQQTLARVEESEIRDFRLFRSGPLENAISLGVFSQRDNAERWADAVRNKGLDVVVREKAAPKEVYRLRVKGADTPESSLALKQISDGTIQQVACR